jgi:hypothetical protein
MTFWVAGAVVVGGMYSARQARRAGDQQADAARQAAELQQEQYVDQTARLQPWYQAGEQALNQLAPLASQYTPFGMDQFQEDPGYAFRLSEGTKALERSAAARGGLLSGATLRGITRYGQDMGSQEYQNAFNRYQAERNARLNPLQSLAGVGLTTAQTLGTSGQTMANNVGEMLTSGAAARASGYVGQANALTSALGGGINYFQNQQMLNRFMQPQQQRYTPSGNFGSDIYGDPT